MWQPLICSIGQANSIIVDYTFYIKYINLFILEYRQPKNSSELVSLLNTESKDKWLNDISHLKIWGIRIWYILAPEEYSFTMNIIFSTFYYSILKFYNFSIFMFIYFSLRQKIHKYIQIIIHRNILSHYLLICLRTSINNELV